MNLLPAFQNDPFFSSVDLPQVLIPDQHSGYENDPLVVMQNMMSHMGHMMNHMENGMNSNQFNGQSSQRVSYRSSTVMSMNSRHGEQPRIIQATSEKFRGPDGLEQTRKAVCDTARNIERMEVAHRLGDRGHRVTKERDPLTGQFFENREVEHINDVNQFENEWLHRAQLTGLSNLNGNGLNLPTHHLPARRPIFGRFRSQSQEPRCLAIEEGRSNHGCLPRKGRRKK